jgi:chromosome segregation ATPase
MECSQYVTLLQKEWNELMKSNISNTNALGAITTGLEKANERLEKANERLEKARDYHLQLTHQAPDSSVLHAIHELARQQQRDKEKLARQQQRDMEEIKEALVSLRHKESSTSMKEGALGESERLRMTADGLMIDAAIEDNEDAFWSPETQDQANAITNEAAFDAFITPLFDNVLADCDMVFINSERYP